MGCGDCHSPRDAFQNPIPGRELQGGGVNLNTTDNPIYASPITGNVLTAEGYTRELFIAMMHTGVRPWGAGLPAEMSWRSYGKMTDSDLTAIWNYLLTLKTDTPWPTRKAPAATTAAPTTAQ